MDNLSQVFDLEPVPNAPLPVVVDSKESIVDDSELARRNLKQLIETSKTALEHALSMAVQSENPRAYEVLAGLINTSADLNTKLMDVHAKEQKMMPNESTPVSQTITNNVVFTGTTSELNELIMKQIKGT